MRITIRMSVVLLALAVTVAWTGWASAAGQAAVGTPPREAFTLEPVTVTAQKREEDVQGIAASVDVITAETISDAGVENMEELYLYTPNVYRSGSFVEHAFVIRGITTFQSSVTPNAPLYVDDVPLPLHYAHNIDLMDVERVEVLKGPQGTLYGMNSESGVFNVVTRKPDNESRWKVFSEYGSDNALRVGAVASGPLEEDVWYARLAVQREASDGHVTNIATDDGDAAETQHLNLRGTLRWTPTDPWDVSLSADYFHADDDIMDVRASEGALAVAGYLESDFDYELFSHQEGSGVNLTAKRKGAEVDFLSVTGIRTYTNHYNQDNDVSSSAVTYFGETDFSYRSTIFSQEFRLSSPESADRFSWLAGFYGYHDQLDIVMTNYRLRAGPAPIQWRDNDITKNGAALFGEGTYALLDDLRFTAGLRAAYDVLDGEYETMNGIELEDTLSTFELLPKLALSLDITENAMAYASLTRGFLTGGFNYSSAADMRSYTYDPEYTWNYEVGLKTAWLDKRLTVNVAGFYIPIKDKQTMSWDPAAGTMAIHNVAEAHTLGAELELAARPARGWLLFGGLGVLKAEIDECVLDEAAGGTYDYKGKRLPDVPAYTFNLGTQYNHDSGAFGRVELLGVGDFTGDLKNKSKEDGYQLVNAKLGWEWDFGSVYAWCDNLFGVQYAKSVYAWDMTGTGEDRQVLDGDPRTVGLGVSLSF